MTSSAYIAGMSLSHVILLRGRRVGPGNVPGPSVMVVEKDVVGPSARHDADTYYIVINPRRACVILHRMAPILGDACLPHPSQTAYQSGLSCIDAIYYTQEALLKHMRDGGKPYLCLYDVEKAFDSLEVPILLTNLFDAGVNGKCWWLLKSWYDHPTCRVKHDGLLSESFVVERGIRQGSVLSPTLFLVVMDLLLRKLSQKSIGLSIHDLYVGSGGHADDIRTIAANKSSLMSQTLLVRDFIENTCLKRNVM